ncbi:DUF288 domain-containing protein [Polynucleobacter paneuropaeus]|uniref:DUF288 domain-containing protein n=1 Tax=Polynucleobacter paneuropaeus TaxID=2527775 RepID=A0A9Q2WDP8_9BURK|nr:DUF288 domain-containing protein [Polynucleobacter paneuropaeus]
MQNTIVVITSIFPPTEAVKKFSEKFPGKVIIVGDKKSPSDYKCDDVNFIPFDVQLNSKFEISKLLPPNHYCRKMLGYLFAIEAGATQIIDTDDDNIPKALYSFPEFNGEFKSLKNTDGFVNVYELYSSQKIWPRGLPLRLINQTTIDKDQISKKNCNVGIWQALADEDPDVDAIYRLTSDVPCNFIDFGEVTLPRNVISPFNSQNTLFRSELFPLMYLPTTVTFRYTDILRSYIAQPIMWANGYELGFCNSSVIQKRNPHDYTKDFESEIPMYITCEQVVKICMKSIQEGSSISDNLLNCYSELAKANIVESSEIFLLEKWLIDLDSINKNRK